MLRSALVPPKPPAAASTPAAASAPAPDAAQVQVQTGPQQGTPGYVVLLLVRYQAQAQAWGLSRLVLGTRGLRHTPGLRFVRVLGSGQDSGFGLKPGWDRQGLIAFFDNADQARDFAVHSQSVEARRARAAECLVAQLQVVSSRGRWGGVSLAPPGSPAATAAPVHDGPIASLTRAAIRPRHALHFWRHSPATETSLRQAPGCRLAAGLGEAPLLRQATFSLWDNTAALQAYAQQGAHHTASQRAWQRNWFSEWMFVRFKPLVLQGQWQGQHFD